MGSALPVERSQTWRERYEAQWAPDVPPDTEYVPRNAGGFSRRTREVFYALDARVPSLVEKLAIELIDDLTVCQEGSPVWVVLEDREFQRHCRATRNGVHEALDHAMKPERQWVERRRYAGDARKYEYRVHRENFSRGGLRPMRKCKPRKAMHRAAHAVAHFADGSPGEPAGMPTPVGRVAAPPPVEMPPPVGRSPNPSCPFSELQCAGACERPLLLKKIEELQASKELAGEDACYNQSANVGTVGTDLINPTLRPFESDLLGVREDTQENSPVLGTGMARRAGGRRPPVNSLAGNGDALQFWLSRQPFGWRSRVDGKPPLAPDQLAKALQNLREWGWTDEAFVAAMRERGEIVADGRESIGGLLRYLIRSLPRRVN